MTQRFNRARKTKDKNFDGKFFFAVKTTGVFCRPSCPSPIAKDENVVYFQSIFSALEQGFRPCLRCKPDVNIEYYNGNINGTQLVNQALLLIYDGYLSYHTLNELAAELKISERHLRQLFIDNLGIAPVKIAQYHKALFAKKLLSRSEQTVTDIAFAAGFGSIRQFNEVFKKLFGQSPTETRKAEQNDDKSQVLSATKPATPTLHLHYNKPFNFQQMLDFMAPRCIRGVELISNNSYSRTFRMGSAVGYFKVTDMPESSLLALTIQCNDIRCFMAIHNRVRKMFDLDTDFSAINRQFSSDPLLKKAMRNNQAPRLPVAFDPFEFTVRAILGQQISVKAATTLASRICEKAALKTQASFPSELNYFFPQAEQLIQLSLDQIGISKTRQTTIQTTTQAVIDKRLTLNACQSFEQFHEDFIALKGIGDWTINYVAMRGLGFSDALPASDLGVIKALTVKGERPSAARIIKIAEKWRPFRSYATLCLWQQGMQ